MARPITPPLAPHAHDADYADISHAHDWAGVTGKPATFPPDVHTHPVGDISATGTADATTYLRGDGTWETPVAVDSVNAQTGIVVLDADDIDDAATTHKFVAAGDLAKLSALSGTNTGDQDLSGYSPTTHDHAAAYAALAHGHVIADTTGLQAALDAKAATAHTHSTTDLTATGGTSTSFLRKDNTWATPTDTNTTYTEISEAEITTGTATTARSISGRRAQFIVTKAQTTVPDPTLNAHAASKLYVDTAVGAKANTAHTHVVGDVTGLQTALDAKADDTDLASYLTTAAAPELIRDTMGTALVAGTNVTITPNDVGDTITIAATGSGGTNATNLTATLAPTQITVNSDTGTDAVLPAADGTNAGLFLPAEKTKLTGIAAGAEVNVNADWNAASGDAQILNKPTIGTAAAMASTAFATAAQGATADSAVQPAGLTKSAVGLGNVDNTSDASKPISTATATALAGKATTAQGAKADTAVQPGSLAAVATSGAYSDLSGAPTAVTLAGDGVATTASRSDHEHTDANRNLNIGQDSYLISATDATAIGAFSAAAGSSTAIGNGAFASGTGSTVIGEGAFTSGTGSTVIGRGSSATNVDQAITIGVNASNSVANTALVKTDSLRLEPVTSGGPTPIEMRRADGTVKTVAINNSDQITIDGVATGGGSGGGVTDHTLLTSIGTNTHAQIDTHIASTSNPHGVTAAQAGAPTTATLAAHTGATAAHGATGAVVGTTNTQTLSGKTLTTPTISSTGFTNAQHAHAGATSGGQIPHSNLTGIGTNTHAQIDSHVASTANPHSVTKTQVGLSNVDNTADSAKPVSTAQATAIGLKADASALTTHTGSTTNPHSVTKSQVGLGNADNTSDASKPISTAVATALSGKAGTTHTHAISDTTGLQTAIDGKAATSHGHDTGYMRVVVHGAAASTARPAADAVYWIGTVEPMNAVDADLWIGGA